MGFICIALRLQYGEGGFSAQEKPRAILDESKKWVGNAAYIVASGL